MSYVFTQLLYHISFAASIIFPWVSAKLYAAAAPGTIFLAGGIPNASTFPFAKVSIELKDGKSFTLDGKTLENALQYQPTPG